MAGNEGARAEQRPRLRVLMLLRPLLRQLRQPVLMLLSALNCEGLRPSRKMGFGYVAATTSSATESASGLTTPKITRKAQSTSRLTAVADSLTTRSYEEKFRNSLSSRTFRLRNIFLGGVTHLFTHHDHAHILSAILFFTLMFVSSRRTARHLKYDLKRLLYVSNNRVI